MNIRNLARQDANRYRCNRVQMMFSLLLFVFVPYQTSWLLSSDLKLSSNQYPICAMAVEVAVITNSVALHVVLLSVNFPNADRQHESETKSEENLPQGKLSP